jgi:hypothetical protein
MTKNLDPALFFTDTPTASLPAVEGLYVAHPVAEMQPAVLYAAEMVGVAPPYAFAGSIATLAYTARVGHHRFHKLVGMDDGTQARYDAWSKAAQDQLEPFFRVGEPRESPMDVRFWPLIAGNIVAATEPAYPITDAKMHLALTLHAALPHGIGTATEEPTTSQKKRALAEYGAEKVHTSAVALGEEICLAANSLVLMGLATGLAQGAIQRGAEEPDAQMRETLSEVFELAGPLRGGTFSNRFKHTEAAVARINDQLRAMRFETIEPSLFTLTAQSIRYFNAVSAACRTFARDREATQREAQNDLQSYYAEVAQQAYSTLRQPYSFVSKKELRNSPYWPLHGALTGHGKEPLPFAALSQEHTTELLSTLRRLVQYVAETPDDPDQAYACIRADLDEEQALSAEYERRRRAASLGVVPPAKFTALRGAYRDLADRWPKLQGVVRGQAAVPESYLDEIGLLLTMIREEE